MSTEEKSSKTKLEEDRKIIAKQFCLKGELEKIVPYGNGHINDTFLAQCKLEDGGEQRYIFQRMNTDVFKEPEELMENIIHVTSFLKKKITAVGGDPERETLNLIPAKSGAYYYKSEKGEYWRVYLFIEDASSLERVEEPNDFYQTAVAFGKFQYLLGDFSAEILHETIKDFHNTPERFSQLKEAIEKDSCQRVSGVRREIEFAMEREAQTHILMDLLEKGELPLRVTHNDTKLNNIMIDDQTRKGICVIDLDTVMPGLSVTDFGDSIRFGANTAAEDEPDESKVSCDLSLFELYAKGYLEGCNGSLTKKEIEMLPMGAKMMTLECGMRFLTDYLQGDTYFKIHRENQNLDRCRCQFALVKDMEEKWEDMEKIIERLNK